MKKILSIVLVSILILIQGCTSQDNKNPIIGNEKKIQEYYNKILNDPKSYEAIKTDVLYTDNISTILKHSYRAKNSYNALIKKISYFKIVGEYVIEIDDSNCLVFKNLIRKEVLGESKYDSNIFFQTIGMDRRQTETLLNAGGKYKVEEINRLLDIIRNYKDSSELIDILRRYYGSDYVSLLELIYYTSSYEIAPILSDCY